MDGEAEDGGQEVVAEDGTHHVGSQGDQEAGADFLDFRKDGLILLFLFPGNFRSADQGGAVSGPSRFLLAQTIKEGGRDNGVNVGNSQDDNGKVVVVDGLIAGDPLIDLGQGDSTAAIASAHDGKDVVGDDPARGNPKDQADSDAEDGCPQDPA